MSAAAGRPTDGAGESSLALACVMIAAGGLLLGMQIDGNGRLAGAGYAPLALGGLVALVASLVQLGRKGRLPRGPLTATSAAMSFFGITFLVGGVLVPGGSWMFWELVVLLWVLSRRRAREQFAGPEVGGAGLSLLGLMLVFRIWLTWQASRHSWQLFTVDVPLVARLPFAWIDSMRTLTVGAFSQQEMGFPPTGIDFPVTVSLWSAGFALCAVGLWMRGHAAREVEIERVHALIQVLPPQAALVVERLVPEAEWEALGFFGLPERRLARRIEGVVAERVQRQMQLEGALRSVRLLPPADAPGFPAGIRKALAEYRGEEEEA